MLLLSSSYSFGIIKEREASRKHTALPIIVWSYSPLRRRLPNIGSWLLLTLVVSGFVAPDTIWSALILLDSADCMCKESAAGLFWF